MHAKKANGSSAAIQWYNRKQIQKTSFILKKNVSLHLKGWCCELFVPLFHDFNSCGPLIYMLKYFCKWFQIRWDIRLFENLPGIKSLCGIIDTVELQ